MKLWLFERRDSRQWGKALKEGTMSLQPIQHLIKRTQTKDNRREERQEYWETQERLET